MAFDYETCDKDQLRIHAENLGMKKLDMRKSLEDLVGEVQAQEYAVSRMDPEDKPKRRVKPTHLLHKVNGRVQEYTDALWATDSYYPCNDKGETVQK
jgi:hypothetical protein